VSVAAALTLGLTAPGHHARGAPVAAPAGDDADTAEGSQSGPPESNEADGARAWTTYAPAGVDVSQIRNVEPLTRIYVDVGVARSNDLSALPYMEGRGRNLRAALGGSLRLGRFQLDIELPAFQATTLDVTRIPGGEPQIEDQHQTALSIGDLRLGAQWTVAPFDAAPFLLGLGLRGRFPTHTVQFKFHLPDDSLGVYSFPYYFHIEPTILMGGGVGPLSFVMNQGPLILMGPDVNFEQIHFVVPTITFWDSHYAAVVAPHRALAISVELNTILQFGHVGGLDFMTLNHVQAWSIIPGIQLHLGATRIDAVGRIGLSRGADLLGVIGYGGTDSVTLRVTRVFN
jgi:hypothetical protein